MLPLMDASRDSRIHDWIAEQYSFALSEFQDDYLSRDDPPSLRESKLLPDDFDLLTRPPPRPQRDTDSDRDSQSTHSCDPPLLPSPLPLPHDAPPDDITSPDSTDLEDAFHGLVREMNSWRFLPASRSALTLTLSDRNKVGFTLLSGLALVHARILGTSISAFSTSHPHFGTLSFPTSDCPIVTHFFLFSFNPLILFPAPTSALEGSRSRPVPFHRRD